MNNLIFSILLLLTFFVGNAQQKNGNEANSSQSFELNKGEKLQNVKEILPNALRKIVAQPREVIQGSAINSFYLAGEKIEFDAVLTNNSTQNMANPPLYVDLIDLEKGKLIHHFTLKLEGRKANFSYRLPLDLQTGNYQIRA